MLKPAASEERLSPEVEFQLSKLYCDRGDLELALSHLEPAIIRLEASENWDLYLEAQALCLRVHAERDNFQLAMAIAEKLTQLVGKQKLQLSSRVYYTMGVCSSYRNQLQEALNYFQMALKLALSAGNQRDMCYAVTGLAIVYYQQNQLQESLSEIARLDVFFQVLPIPSLHLSSQILRAHILRKQKKFDNALTVLGGCNELLRVEKNFFMHLYVLYGLSITHQDAGDLNSARLYLELARASVDPANMRSLANRIDARLAALGVRPEAGYDLVFNADEHTLIEPRRGRVDFKNQFVLIDLMRLFMQSPGEVFSKETLTQQVWRQIYDPSTHDNKIYVTIKRLRKMIEPDFDRPRYIFRAKNGYYLEKKTRVLID